ncbi:DUF5959 family protein [Streptomyces sp. NPDC055749]
MTERGPIDLVHLADEENSVIVRVAGPATEVRPWDGCLDVDIVVASEFAEGRLSEVCLLPEDLDDWEEAVDLLTLGQPVLWMDDGRNPEIRITPEGPYISRSEALNAIEVVVRTQPCPSPRFVYWCACPTAGSMPSVCDSRRSAPRGLSGRSEGSQASQLRLVAL